MTLSEQSPLPAWPHSGFHVHDEVRVPADDREFAVRLARYCARNPVALSRLEYPSDNATVTYHSDKCRSNLFRLARFSLGLRLRFPETHRVVRKK